jgi:hypothetical protein
LIIISPAKSSRDLDGRHPSGLIGELPDLSGQLLRIGAGHSRWRQAESTRIDVQHFCQTRSIPLRTNRA